MYLGGGGGLGLLFPSRLSAEEELYAQLGLFIFVQSISAKRCIQGT